MESIYTAIILGIIEGLTEFLPVSSTGHLIIASELLHLEQKSHAAFNIIIQLGAILAVVYLYRQRLISLSQIKNIKTKGLNAIHISLGIFPILAIGFFSRKFIKAHLFNPQVVVASFIIVGVIMLLVEKFKPKPNKDSLDQLSYLDALVIGLLQCFALIPGVSRAGATMIGAIGRGVNVITAADFSFLISVPVIFIATVYEFLKSYQEFNSSLLLELFIGLLVSFIVAIFSIKGFLAVLKKFSLTPFAIYRIVIGILYLCYGHLLLAN